MNAKAHRSQTGHAPDATPLRSRPARPRRQLAALLAVVAVVAVGLMAPAVAPTHVDAEVPSAPAGAEAPTTATTTESSLDPNLVAQLEAALDQGFAESRMPGVTAALWIPGQGEWVAHRGVSDTETGEPMNRANQHKIGSITKTLTGMIALQIIGEGRFGLTLDDTIDRWYPDFPEASSITVRMLMNMSSGVGMTGEDEITRVCADPYSTVTPDELIAIGAAIPRASFAPGDGYAYSTTNTTLLARILEKTTGTDLATLLDERLLVPLGMTRSRFAPDGQLAAPLTHGYTDWCNLLGVLPRATDTTDWYLHWAWAAGAMVSTIDDLHAWGTALGSGFGLTPEMLAARVDDTVSVQPLFGQSDEYGLGVQILRDLPTSCVTSLYHSGSLPGYGSWVQSFPSSGSVFALMGNSNGNVDETGGGIGALWLALYPVAEQIAALAPTESCTPPPPTTVAVTPVVAEPAFTG